MSPLAKKLQRESGTAKIHQKTQLTLVSKDEKLTVSSVMSSHAPTL